MIFSPLFLCLNVQEKVIDPFVIYTGRKEYSTLREVLTEALNAKQVENLEEVTQVRM